MKQAVAVYLIVLKDSLRNNKNKTTDRVILLVVLFFNKPSKEIAITKILMYTIYIVKI